jgi:hypothetical protein
LSKEFVSKDFCNERFLRILEKLEHIEAKIDKMVSDKLEEVGLAKKVKRRSHEALRVFFYAVLGGAIVAAINYIFSRL